jgi:hypothetical protein
MSQTPAKATIVSPARATTHDLEAEALVEPLRSLVRGAHLEGQPARADLARQVGDAHQQLLAHPAAPPIRMDAEGGDVRVVDHQPHPGEGHDRVSDARHDVACQAIGGELLLQGIRRPRRAEAQPLDLLHRRQVVEGHRIQADRGTHSHRTLPSGTGPRPRGGRP